MKKIIYVIIVCAQFVIGCTNNDFIDPFIGKWTCYENDLRISKNDSLYIVDIFNKSGKLQYSYSASKKGDILSYRDNKGIGKQIRVYVPVNTFESEEGNLVLDYNDSLNIRLIINGVDYYKFFETNHDYRLKGFYGTWKSKTRRGDFGALSIDSTSQGINVTWIGDPNSPLTEFASLQGDLLHIVSLGIDGGTYATYFRGGDYISINDDIYYRYNEVDENFLGYWKNQNGEIKISKNGKYYLVLTHQFEDYTFTFLTEAKGNKLVEPFDKYSPDRTYTEITYIEPGVISDDGGKTKYYNTNKYSKSNYHSSNIIKRNSITKKYSGNVGKLGASYSLTWYTDGTIIGSYFYPNRSNITYSLTGNDLGNGRIELIEYTGNNVSANCSLTLQGNCYIGQMNNTDGRKLKMTMCLE